MKKLFTFIMMGWLFLTSSAISQDWDQSHYYNGKWYNFVDQWYSGLPTDYVTGLVFDGPDTVWVSGDWGLSVWTKIWTQIGEEKKLGWTHWNLSDIPPEGDRIAHLVRFSDHQLLVATDYDADQYTIQTDFKGSLWMVDLNDMSWKKLLDRRVRDIVVENTDHHKIYTACDTSLIVFDPQNDFSYQAYTIHGEYDHYTFDRIRSLVFDKNGKLWIVNSNVKEWADQRPGYVVIWNTVTHKIEWQTTSGSYLDIIYDPIRECIHVSAKNRKVYKFSLSIPPEKENPIVTIYSQNWNSITIDQFGFMWVADYERKLLSENL